MNRTLAIIGVLVIGLGVVAMSTLYTVHQTVHRNRDTRW